MTMWIGVEDTRCFAVVKWHFDNGPRHFLRVWIGETVRIRGETRDWFLVTKSEAGVADNGSGETGIVPKNHVHIQESYVLPFGEFGDSCIIPRNVPPLVQEITDVLKEWHKVAKSLYLQGNGPLFDLIRGHILSLHSARASISSPECTVDGRRGLKKQVADIIDTGNILLKLDMTVRDEAGNRLNPSITSTVELYRQHQASRDRLDKKSASAGASGPGASETTLCIALTVERVTWRVVDECQVRFYLYDADEDRVFTEAALMVLHGAGQQQVQAQPLKATRFLFTDLGSRDVDRGRVFLIAFIVRVGPMEWREEKSTPFSVKASAGGNVSVRRPWGVGARDVSHLLKHKQQAVNSEWNTSIPFVPFGESESLKAALTKCVESGGGKESGVGSFQCSVQVLVNFKCQAAAEDGAEGPGTCATSSGGGGSTGGIDVVVRKMGFPEVILPHDVRNELYVTLVGGEFARGSKSADKNVQVSMSAHNDRGQLIRGILHSGNARPSSSGVGSSGTDVHHSVVYYHDTKPKWAETVKVALPMIIEEFASTHLRFTFKHRSSSESKDRAEKPFALAYFKLRADKGTAVPDDEHRLRIYKIDAKVWREGDLSYLALPSVWAPGPPSGQVKSHVPGLSWTGKDSFSIHSTLCSTKFTQNEHLLELLQWSSKTQEVRNHQTETNESRIDLGGLVLQKWNEILSNVSRVAGEEIVKFLPYIFDALFHVLVKPVELILAELGIVWDGHEGVLARFQDIKDKCDRQIFDCLIYIFEVVLKPQYQKFKSVLAHYIEDDFTATLAYKKLIKELDGAFTAPQADKILKIMKSLSFFFKFIIRSFCIRLQLEAMDVEVVEWEGEKEAEAEFEASIVTLFNGLNSVICRTEPGFLAAQGSVLRYLPGIIEPLVAVLHPLRLSELLVDLLRWVRPGQLVKEKLSTIGEIVKSSLFRDADCRNTLLPIMAVAIREHLPGNDNEMRRRLNETTKIRSKNKITQTLGEEAQRPVVVSVTPSHSDETLKAVELLSDMMDILFRTDIGPVADNITYIMHVLIGPLIQSIATIGEKDGCAGAMVSILLGLLRAMSRKHYVKLISQLRKAHGESELIAFMHELLGTLKALSVASYFPPTWAEMILLQNSIILGALKQLSPIIKSEYSGETFQELLWNNFFSCAVSFLAQESLALDGGSRAKRANVLASYGDMRREAAGLIHVMWFSLGQSKRLRFVPYMVGVFLEMAFVKDEEIQRSAIPIFFDMMRCEYEGGGGGGGTGTIDKMEDELVKRLVELIEGGRGDETFRATFQETMSVCCDHDNSGLQALGIKLVGMATKLIDLLLEYRQVGSEAEPGNTMNCIVNLLDWSRDGGRKELYLRYLYKLHELHVAAGNYTEAAFTLKLHSRQLEWTEEECPVSLGCPLWPRSAAGSSSAEVKEGLYYAIINYFDRAHMWECALEVTDELRSQYAEESYNYGALSSLLQRMASFYTSILSGVRAEPEYFRVAFFGTSFPSFLQDRAFVYRGREYEKLSEFEARLLERFPKAELLRSLNRPSEEIRSAGKQYLQICKVDPVMNTGNKRLSAMAGADEAIRKYYRANNVNKFVFSRPYHRQPKDPSNEFASLWLDRTTLWTASAFPGVMSWFLVVKESAEQVKPIVKAIESMEEVNEMLREMVLKHAGRPAEDLGELSMKLTGILDAVVMGGVANYESAFLTDAYLVREAQDGSLVDRLKTLICGQVPIVYECMLIHEKKAPESLAELHAHLQECYDKLILHMRAVYGVELKGVRDGALARDMERAARRKVAQSKRHEPGPLSAPSVDLVQSRHNYGPSVGILARGKGSFSSTMSLYSSGFTPKTAGFSTKSMVSISKAQRRSTQGAFDEGAVAAAAHIHFSSGLNKSRDSAGFFSRVENRRSYTTPSPSEASSCSSAAAERTSTLSLPLNNPLNNASVSASASSSSLDNNLDQTQQQLTPPPLPPKLHQTQMVAAEEPPEPPPKPPLRVATTN